MGAATTMLGPLLPYLSARWALTDEEAGRFFVAQFAGSLLGALGSGWLLRRFGWRLIGPGGHALVGAGAFALASRHPAKAFAGMAVCGLGLGLLIPATNLLVATAKGARAPAALNLLNFGWCLGAVAAPVAIATSLPTAGIGGFAKGVACLEACALVAIRLSAKGTSALLPPLEAGSGGSTAGAFGRLTLLAALFQFLYVGTENSVSGWLPSYLSRCGWSAPAAAAAQAILWAGVLAGRLLAPLALRRADARGWMLFSLIVALAGILLVLSPPWWPAQIGGVGLAGLGLAAVFPTSVALYLERAGGRAVPAAGFVFACGALGGATVPWAAGMLAEFERSLRAALLVPASLVVVMILTEVNPSFRSQRRR